VGRARRARGSLADPAAPRLLTIEGELDDISGQGQTRAAHKLCTGIAESEREHLTVAGAGHYGIFSGRRWRTQVYPQVRDFIARHAAKADPAN
jgi:poly(3-hydroxybutyrate) depolymerase